MIKQPNPWPAFQGLLENAIYGGRIDVPQDALILENLLKKIFAINIFNMIISVLT